MVRRLVLDELLRRRERRQRQGAVCRVGRLHEGRRHRHQHRFLAFHLPRQHLVQDTQEPEGDDRVRLLGNEGQHAPLVGYRHLLDDRGPRHVHACHAPRLPGRRHARPGNQQHDHLGRMVRPLLYEQLHGTPHDGQFQPRMGNRRRAARRDAGCQPQLLQDRQPAPGGQRNLQPAPHLREVGADQPLQHAGLPELPQDLRAGSYDRGHGRVRLHEKHGQRPFADGHGRRFGQGADAGRRDGRHGLGGHQHQRGALLLFRAPELRLQEKVPLHVHVPRRRLVEIRRGKPLGIFPCGVGRLGGLGGEILERAQFQQLQDTRLVRPDG